MPILKSFLKYFCEISKQKVFKQKFGGKIWKLSDLKFIISDCKLELEA